MKPRLVGLFGGSFNPPHNGHVAAARRAWDALGLETLIIMPVGTPPHKPLPPGTPSLEHRLAMTQLAFEGCPGCVVSDWEMRKNRPVYTFETLERMRPDNGQITLIVGSDMFLTLHEWVRAEDILAGARVAVLVRTDGQSQAVGRQAAFLAGRFQAAVDWIEHTPVDISSTELRAMLRAGHGRAYLPESVYGYIREKNLYGVTAYDA